MATNGLQIMVLVREVRDPRPPVRIQEQGGAVRDTGLLARLLGIRRPDLFLTGSRLLDRGDDPAAALAAATVGFRAGELDRCLAGLAGVDYPRGRLEVVVVDDGSRDGSARVARAHGAAVVASGGVGRGPGGARNRGAVAAAGEILAFLDSDCVPSARWLSELVGWFADPEVAAVGGLVEGLRSAAALDRYEAAMSSLSLGSRERGAGGGTPSTCRAATSSCGRAPFRTAGGFRPGLRVGEDVDLSWRLRDRGGRIVYAAAGPVSHEHRSRLGPFLRRRFEYGTSEGSLQALHPLRRKRLVLPPCLAASLLLAALAVTLRSWVPAGAGAAVLAWDAQRFGSRLTLAGLEVPTPGSSSPEPARSRVSPTTRRTILYGTMVGSWSRQGSSGRGSASSPGSSRSWLRPWTGG